MPLSFHEISPQHSPLFLTDSKFLSMLNATLPVPFPFVSREPSREQHAFAPEPSQDDGMQDITYDYFEYKMWNHMNEKLTKSLHPKLVFTEIQTVIKAAPRGSLSLEEYVDKQDRHCPLSRQQRTQVYTLYEQYEKMKKSRREYDKCDVLQHIHEQLERHGYQGHLLDFVYVDEVQDLSMLTLRLLKFTCASPRGLID